MRVKENYKYCQLLMMEYHWFSKYTSYTHCINVEWSPSDYVKYSSLKLLMFAILWKVILLSNLLFQWLNLCRLQGESLKIYIVFNLYTLCVLVRGWGDAVTPTLLRWNFSPLSSEVNSCYRSSLFLRLRCVFIPNCR